MSDNSGKSSSDQPPWAAIGDSRERLASLAQLAQPLTRTLRRRYSRANVDRPTRKLPRTKHGKAVAFGLDLRWSRLSSSVCSDGADIAGICPGALFAIR